MAYEKINFVNGTAPPINATFLNTLQDELITNGVGKETYTQNFSLGYFSEDVVKGALTEMTIEGLTVDNQVVNGDVTTNLISDNTGTLMDINTDGTWEFLAAYDATNQTFNIVSGNEYFLYAKILDSSVGDLKDFLRLVYSDATNQVIGTGANGFNEVSGTITANKSLLANFKLAEGNTGQIDRDYQMLIDKTSLGIASYTDAQMLDLVRQGYFEGVKSVGGSYKTTGKNLINEQAIEADTTISFGRIPAIFVNKKLLLDTGGTATRSEYRTPINFKNGETYIFKLTDKVVNSGSGNLISIITDASTINTVKALTENVSFLWDLASGVYEFGLNTDLATGQSIEFNVQLEQGTTATDHEEYIEGNGTLPQLLSVSDGTNIVRDLTQGQFLTHNVVDGSIDVQNATSWAIGGVLTNTHYFQKNLETEIDYKRPDSNLVLGKYILKIGDITFTNTIGSQIGNDVENIYAIGDTSGDIFIRVNKTTYPNTAAFEAFLQANEVKAYFEADTPTTENLDNEIVIATDSKGSLEFEGIYPDLDSKAPTNLKAQVDSIQSMAIKNNNDLESMHGVGYVVKTGKDILGLDQDVFLDMSDLESGRYQLKIFNDSLSHAISGTVALAPSGVKFSHDPILGIGFPFSARDNFTNLYEDTIINIQITDLNYYATQQIYNTAGTPEHDAIIYCSSNGVKDLIFENDNVDKPLSYILVKMHD